MNPLDITYVLPSKLITGQIVVLNGLPYIFSSRVEHDIKFAAFETEGHGIIVTHTNISGSKCSIELDRKVWFDSVKGWVIL
ncbi:hypothetical protein fHeYen901_92 [Yersinia phage fHe-Yen9-01]|uniref:Uncharacterized protein n=1 Tax=Yersinia phage fHe-Yen9-01 TaxID=1965363 RepID=A0A1V0DXJ5_9CAUD|nr:hypothetical protein KNT60_gp091 [Yersinia phage fHe-Yen9-01]ARB05865.1 hypothetical protein fHeYen901_92 [Yersinia phage fHe-Yen9-01]